MKPFLDRDFLLSTPTAQALFHGYAEKLPIIDYHCHINPREIAENRQFENITQVWLGGDHYKWRLMRSAGVDEHFITGDASDYEKFQKWAETLSHAVGNPLYHWSHLELQRCFGYDGILNAETCDAVWAHCNAQLARPELRVRGLITRFGVTTICTTDDPADTLEWHQQLAADSSFSVKVLPAWRPDKAMNIEKPDFAAYLRRLSAAADVEITDLASLKQALSRRMDFFASLGCVVSDHAHEYVCCVPADDAEIARILAKGLCGEACTADEIRAYKTAFMQFCGAEYARRGWVMQLHYGCRRDNNTPLYAQLGPDTGFDCIDNHAPSAQLAAFLDNLQQKNALPKTILYSLNPNDNQAIDTILGCFQDSSAVGKIQHGAAWWFNDHKTGMRDHLISLGNLGYLAGFVGMLTDSRSFLSYTRHEYFRRILCDFLGTLVEDGEYPDDMQTLGEIVQNISYHNAERYFGF